MDSITEMMSIKANVQHTSCRKEVAEEVAEGNEDTFEAGYNKAIGDVMKIIDSADDCANAMYLLGQFIIGRKLSEDNQSQSVEE